MAQVTQEFILNKVEELDYPFFCIYDADGKTRLYHNYQVDSPTSTEARGQLIEAFEAISGNVTVELKKQIKAGGDVRQMVTYKCNLSSNNYGVNGMKPVTTQVGPDVDRLLQLQADNFRIQMEAMREAHKRDLEMVDLKRQMTELKNGDFFEKHGEKLIGALPYILNGLTGKPSMPIAGPIVNGPGHPDVETVEHTAADEANADQLKLENLLQRMFAVDPEFLNNLEKLVHLAENKPEIYKIALNSLHSL
jgi:hypothetical protein